MKTALVLSVIVNVIFMVTVGYLNATAVVPDYAPPFVIYTTNGPTAAVNSLSFAQQ